MLISRLALVVMLVALVSCATTSKEDMQKAQAHYKLGVSHLNSGKIQPAYVEFQTALSLDPNNKAIHNGLGTVYLQLSDLEAAEEYYQNAVRIDPSFSDAHNNLCYVYYQLRQWGKAIESCKNALKNPLYVTAEKAYYNMARAYYRNKNYDAAIGAYNDAAKRFPGLYLAYYGIALCYNAKGQYGLAAEAMEQGLKFDPQIKGNRDKAEDVFLERKEMGEDEGDIRDYLEILKY
jgi:type IV pilus assembly protein PilF